MNRTVKYQGAFSRIVGFAGKRFLFSPPPPPSTFFCAITRLETLATQATKTMVMQFLLSLLFLLYLIFLLYISASSFFENFILLKLLPCFASNFLLQLAILVKFVVLARFSISSVRFCKPAFLVPGNAEQVWTEG